MQSLPISSVEEIFARMSVTYGSAWAQMWLGLNPDTVKSEWALGLGAFINRPDAIEHALDHLPVDKPPNILQFRVTCMSAPRPEPEPELPGLPAPKVDISRLRAAFTRYKELRAELRKKPLQWAYDLQERERRGEKLSDTSRQKWRDALAHSVKEADVMVEYKPIDPRCLPPGMRPKFIDEETPQ